MSGERTKCFVIMPLSSTSKHSAEDRNGVFENLFKPTMDTSILKGPRTFHKYIKPHEELGGKTPAEAAGIKIEGENKWLTFIQDPPPPKPNGD